MTDTMTAGETTTISPARVLERVLDDVLTDASKWTQGAAARDLAGEQVSGTSPDAVRFCILGAIHHVMGVTALHWREEAYWDLRDAVANCVNVVLGDETWRGTRIANFNDDPSTTFEDVRLVLKRAAAE